jgi:hypothetical protein
MGNFILYSSTGNTDHINECRYSLLKYLAIYNLKPPDIGIIINTNAPAAFESFMPFFKQFELKQTKEGQPVKLELIKTFLSSGEHNVLYLNADSYFIKPVGTIFESIRAGNLLFYKQIISVDKGQVIHSQKIREYLSGSTITIDGNKISFPQNKHFYSTEVIGINSSHIPLLKKMSALYFKLSAVLPSNPSEEFACTYYASNEAVQTVENTISSYRNFSEFKNLLRLFFKKNEEENIPNLVKLVNHIDAETILHEKNQYNSQPFVKKLISTLSGKAWSVRKYQNKF